MSPEGRFPGSPADWLRYAHSDLELARVGRAPHVLLEELCFHAHQAAEKAIKAVLVAKYRSPQLHELKGKTLLEKGFPLNPFPKTFKSFGKMAWKKPFFKRVSSKISARMLNLMTLPFG